MGGDQMARKQKLTPKQAQFVKEYLVDLNQTAAAIRAGYSERTANEMAVALMKKPHIQEAIQQAMKERGKRVEMTADDVLRHIMEAAFLDIRDFVEWDASGNVYYKGASEVDGRFIKSLKSVTKFVSGGEIKEVEFELVNKEKMLELLFKHFGLGNEKLKVETQISLADVLQKAWERRQRDGESK